MKPIKIAIIWFLLFIPIVITIMWLILNEYQNKQNEHLSSLRNHLGEKIEINNLITLEGEKVNLEFNTEITVVDFWFRGCKPCLEEMKQFKPLISGFEEEITIASISIEDEHVWKPLFEKNSNFPFLVERLSNWNHYISADTIYEHNEYGVVTSNGSRFLLEKYGIKSFPCYMVLDNDGILIDTPASAVDFIKQIVENQNEFETYWSKRITSKKYQRLFVLLFIAYSFTFWLVVGVYSYVQKIWKKVANKRYE